MGKGLKLKISARLMRKKTRKRRSKGNARRQCRFCESAENRRDLDFKNAHMLRSFITARGKILPSRISGTCCAHQRCVARCVKLARTMALLPYGMVRA